MAVYALTDKCNLNCIFCCNEDFKVYYSAPDYKPHTISEMKEYFKENIPKYEGNITLTGGEPTLRKDIIEILKFINDNYPNSKILLLTNGRMFSYFDYAKQFNKIKNLEIEVALNSHIEKIQDRLVGVKNSFNQTVQGIKNLLKLGIKTNIRIIITKLNYSHMMDFLEYIIIEFPKINRIVFINLRIKGKAIINKDVLVEKYSTMIPELKKVFDLILEKKIGLQLLHLPFCIINRKYWKYTLKNPYKKELNKCFGCIEKNNCPGVLESYIHIYGTEEFNPMTE